MKSPYLGATARSIRRAFIATTILASGSLWCEDSAGDFVHGRSDLTPAAIDLSGQVREVTEAIRLYQEGNRAAALAALKQAAESHKELPPAKVMLARMLLFNGKLADARGLLEESASEHPAYPGSFALFGNLALNDGRLADAQAIFEKVLDLTNASKISEADRQRYRVRGHAGLAAVAEIRHDWVSAGKSLRRWLEIEPANGAARQRLARALFRSGDRDEALSQFEQSVESDPRLEPPEISFGRLFAEDQNGEEAGRWFAAAIKRNPKDPRVHLASALWLLQQEKPVEAQKSADEALRLDSESSQARLVRGMVARQTENYDLAEQHFSRLVEAAPADFTATNLLALVLIEQPAEIKRSRALQLAEINVRQHPQRAEARSTLGWIYFRLNRLDEAHETLKGAVSGGAASPDTAYFLARLLAGRGDRAEARRLLSEALATPPGQFTYRTQARRWWTTDFEKDPAIGKSP